MNVVDLHAARQRIANRLCEQCHQRPAVTWAWFADEDSDYEMRVCAHCDRDYPDDAA